MILFFSQCFTPSGQAAVAKKSNISRCGRRPFPEALSLYRYRDFFSCSSFPFFSRFTSFFCSSAANLVASAKPCCFCPLALTCGIESGTRSYPALEQASSRAAVPLAQRTCLGCHPRTNIHTDHLTRLSLHGDAELITRGRHHGSTQALWTATASRRTLRPHQLS